MDGLQAGQLVLKKLNDAGYEAYFIGGMVRDQLLGRPIYDVDITTSAHPEVVISLFDRTLDIGIAHGTVTVLIEKIPVEVTTYRVESNYSDFRHPKQLAFTTSLDEDLLRRDFTINAIARNLDGQLYDPFQGLEDLKHKMLRAVGEANLRFQEDPLRMLRALRFVSKLGFQLEDETYLGIQRQRHLLKHLAKERVKKELAGLMEGADREQGIALGFATGVFEEFEDFRALKKYEAYSFNSLNQGLDLFVLAGLEVGDIQVFLNRWPFSKEEKKLIKLMKELKEAPMCQPYIQYRYGIRAAYLNHRITCFFSQEERVFMPCELVIGSRKDLDIKVAEILELSSRTKGPWTGQLLERIEFEVISGTLANEKMAILEFVRKQGALDGKKETKL